MFRGIHRRIVSSRFIAMNPSVIDFFYWITEEDDLIARDVMGTGPDAQMRYIQMLSTLVLAAALRVRNISHEIIDAGKIVVKDLSGDFVRVGCVASHPFASSFLVPSTSETGWIAVVQLDVERRNGRILGWYMHGGNNCNTHVSHASLVHA